MQNKTVDLFSAGIHCSGMPDANTIVRDLLEDAHPGDVIKGRWPEAESTIAMDASKAYVYARDVIKGRWPEAEPTIARHAQEAYLYARDVIKGRWPEGEKAISENPHIAHMYARDVIKRSLALR